MCPLEILPHELLLRIIANLYFPDRLRLRVNRAWTDFINNTPDCWAMIDSRRLPQEFLDRAIARSNNKAEIAYVSSVTALERLLICPLVLVCVDPRSDAFQEIMERLSETLIPMVAVFGQYDIDDVPGISDFLRKRHATLKELAFIDTEDEDTPPILSLQFDKLQYLSMRASYSHFGLGSDNTGKVLATRFPNLQGFNYYGDGYIDFGPMWHGELTDFTQLRQLSIYLRDNTLVKVSLPQGLQALTLSRLDPTVFQNLQLPSLEELDIEVSDIQQLFESFLPVEYDKTVQPSRLQKLCLRSLRLDCKTDGPHLIHLCTHPRLAALKSLALIDLQPKTSSEDDSSSDDSSQADESMPDETANSNAADDEECRDEQDERDGEDGVSKLQGIVLDVAHLHRLELIDFTSSSITDRMLQSGLRAPELVRLDLTGCKLIDGISLPVLTELTARGITTQNRQ